MKILAVPIVAQLPAYCGPASVKMVLEYFGIHRSEKALARLCKTTKKYGTTSENLVVGLEKAGIKARLSWRSSLREVGALLRRGIPSIVNWQSAGIGHYSVIVGLDSTSVYLADPEIAAVRTVSRRTFNQLWSDFRGADPTVPRPVDRRPLISIEPPAGWRLSKKPR